MSKPTPGFWQPKIGQVVWLNYPDCPEPEGRIVGHSDGRFVLEYLRDEPKGPFTTGHRKGDRFAINGAFLLPWPFGGKEWKAAMERGEIEN